MAYFDHASTGIPGLDRVIDDLRLGDNVVWQVDSVAEYRGVVEPFVQRALDDGRRVVYIRFASHEPLVEEAEHVGVYRVEAGQGFESFATAIHRLIAAEGNRVFYVFDCLTDLLQRWHSDLMIGNFFTVSCPFLYELETVAYFALIRNQHTFGTIAGIRGTTQLLLDLYDIDGRRYVHPLKVWDRYSPTMFFPHVLTGDTATSITSSAETARLFSSVDRGKDRPDHWHILLQQAQEALSAGQDQQREVADLLRSVLIVQGSRMAELCGRHLGLADLLAVATREIGTGLIGGKSVGMLMARAILAGDDRDRFADRLEPHDSFYLGADIFYTYIVENGWWKLRTRQKTAEGYLDCGRELQQRLLEGSFPARIREEFFRMLEHFGQSPIIVRSSSLLEDNFGNAFAGKYDSVFCANQGTPEQRYQAFEDAIRRVYASSMSAEALTYRRRRGLVDRDEQMAILVQRVSGDHHGDAFYPHAAGVGNSANLYVWDPDLDGGAGMMRLVCGLGTRAVDRTFHDYARIVSLDDPTRHQVSDPGERKKYSQRYVDVISLADNALVTVPLSAVTGHDIKTDWSLFLSPDAAALERLRARGQRPVPGPTVLDFEGLLSTTDFAALMRDMLAALSAAYDYPVDIEFTVNFASNGDYKINLVQCRPLQTRGLGEAVPMPQLHSPRDCLFATGGDFMGGNVRLPVEYVIYVRAAAYLALAEQDKHAVARQVGVLNRELKGNGVLLLGPGRWGTTTPSLGVPVSFADLSNVTAIGEVAFTDGGFAPELSYGSHFFADLVETGIFYVALFTGRPGVVFNEEWITGRPNLLLELDPQGAARAAVVHVARIEGLEVFSDVVTQRCICRVAGAAHSPWATTIVG
ncbi:MAG TPA: PEP/pyruvate-binding domain-containing protein [Dermatophilaceae bacterium]|nr:PEP/pyruvate-binding domain-containing protein [Dermatophilaceae bacterium]